MKNNTTTIKKTKVRDYLGEETLRFMLLAVNLSNNIKVLNTGNDKIVEEKALFEKRKIKRINSYHSKIKKIIILEANELSDIDINLDVENIDFEEETQALETSYVNSELNEKQYKALNQILIYLKNIFYVQNSYAFVEDKSILQKRFEQYREEYMNHLEKLTLQREYEKKDEFPKGFVRSRSTMKKRIINEHIDFLKRTKTLDGVDKDLRNMFGENILIMVKNVMNMPRFKNYTDNYTTEFQSNAVEKILLYMRGFDPMLLSVISGKESSSFAYITQFCYHAMLEMVNKLNAYYKKRKEDISLNSSLMEGVYSHTCLYDGIQSNSCYEMEDVGAVETININKELSNEELEQLISNKVIEIEQNNIEYEDKEASRYELKLIEKATDAEKELKEYKEYRDDLINRTKNKIKRIEALEVIVPKDYVLDINLKNIKFAVSISRGK